MHNSHRVSSETYGKPQRRPRKLRRSTGSLLLALQLLMVVAAGVWPALVCASAPQFPGLPGGWREDRGQPFDLRTLQGHAVVLTMAYATCHRGSPTTLRRLQELKGGFDRRGGRGEVLL